MRAEKILPGVAAVLIGALSVLARDAGPAESPDWWQVEGEVTAALRKPSADIASLAVSV